MRVRLLRLFLLIFFAGTLAITALVHWYLHWPWVISWMIGANLTAFPMWAWDKYQAGRQKLRVPEMALHAMALLGATPASFLAMGLLRHKNLKGYFQALYAGFLVLQIVLATLFWGVA